MRPTHISSPARLSLGALLGLGALLSLGGCASGPRAALPQLQHRAAYDLSCPANNLRLTHVDQRTKVVTGCGRHLVYLEDCMQHGSDLLCSWRIDSPSKAQTAVASHSTVPAALPAALPGDMSPPGRVYRTDLFNGGSERLDRQPPPRPMSTDLMSGGQAVPADILEGRE